MKIFKLGIESEVCGDVDTMNLEVNTEDVVELLNFVSNYQYLVIWGVLFNIPWKKVLWHGFNKWRPRGYPLILFLFVRNYQYLVKSRILFNIQWKKVLWHGFTKWRPCGYPLIRFLFISHSSSYMPWIVGYPFISYELSMHCYQLSIHRLAPSYFLYSFFYNCLFQLLND